MLLLLLGLIRVAGANEPLSLCNTNQTSDIIPDCNLPYAYTYDDQRQIWDRARDPACLAKMEAAMRAIEPYAGFAPPTGAFVDADYQAVKQQWNDAKAQCWRTP